MGTSVERSSNVHDLTMLAASYEMPAEAVNGMRVEDVHEAIQRAAERARKGEGTYIIRY